MATDGLARRTANCDRVSARSVFFSFPLSSSLRGRDRHRQGVALNALTLHLLRQTPMHRHTHICLHFAFVALHLLTFAHLLVSQMLTIVMRFGEWQLKVGNRQEKDKADDKTGLIAGTRNTGAQMHRNDDDNEHRWCLLRLFATRCTHSQEMTPVINNKLIPALTTVCFSPTWLLSMLRQSDSAQWLQWMLCTVAAS